jgi:hypothetical protein
MAFLLAFGVFAAEPPTVLMPDGSRATVPIPEDVIVWDNAAQEVAAPLGTESVTFTFNFKNTSTNSVTILSVQPSCSCTTANIPPMPWIIEAGAAAQFDVTVKFPPVRGVWPVTGTVTVSTDKGTTFLAIKITT